MDIQFHFTGINRRAYFTCNEECVYNLSGRCNNSKAEVTADGTTNEIACNGFKKNKHEDYPDYIDFILYWVGARDENGNKILRDMTVRTYFSFIAMEVKYNYAPGAEMEFSWKEIASFSGCHSRKVVVCLDQLTKYGLIEYHKYLASKKGCKTILRRILPIPKPDYLLKNLR
jgi:hypothetical protein